MVICLFILFTLVVVKTSNLSTVRILSEHFTMLNMVTSVLTINSGRDTVRSRKRWLATREHFNEGYA